MSQTSTPVGLTPVRLHALAGRLDYLLRTRLWAQIVAAMILGVALGLGLSPRGGAWVPAATGEVIGAPPLEAQWAHILRHCRWKVEAEGSELHAMQSMRTRLMAYSRGMPEAKRLRENFSHVASLAGLETIAEENLRHAAEAFPV